ncbi:MAG: cobalamin-binding protein [Fervidicoccaceae archaeon]
MNTQNKIIVSILILALLLSGISVFLAYESYASSNSIRNALDLFEKQLFNISSQLSSASNSVSAIQSLSSTIQSLNLSLTQKIDQLSSEVSSLKYPIQVYDALNRTVFITQQPQRIVSIAPSITEILFAINASSYIVGVDDYSNYPPIIGDLVKNGTIERVGGFSDISLEKVISLKPDLVIGTTGVQYKFIYQLSQMGITSISLRTESIDDIFSATLLLGKITNHFQDALNLVNELKQRILGQYSLVASKTTTRPSIMYVVWINPIFAAGGGSFWNDIIGLSGGRNALENISQAWPMISWEEVIKANPDVIVLSEYAGGFSNASQFLSWARTQPGGESIKAVKDGKVYMLHGELNDIASRPGPRIAELQLALSLILHPDLYNVTAVPNDLTLEMVINMTSAK